MEPIIRLELSYGCCRERETEAPDGGDDGVAVARGGSSGSTRAFRDAAKSTGVAPQPYFDDVSPRNVTAVVGQSAVLLCRVKHVGDRTVSESRLV
ncbi:hypothetical protein GE061_013627 [Apolygus lucorum]|uniref:Ig-like domain-containing protein n=1 Tax=Apolygus lucorum TaxID=248454 RepID=A0A8S9XQD4_APOLU|nr:hypothetical protein GE061_013627 [Apolygus lucorum]